MATDVAIANSPPLLTLYDPEEPQAQPEVVPEEEVPEDCPVVVPTWVPQCPGDPLEELALEVLCCLPPPPDGMALTVIDETLGIRFDQARQAVRWLQAHGHPVEQHYVGEASLFYAVEDRKQAAVARSVAVAELFWDARHGRD